MSLIYSSAALLKGAKHTFVETQKKLQEQSLVPLLCEKVTSTANSEIYPWIGEAQKMELLASELKFAGLTDSSFSIANNVYKIGIRIQRKMLEDDQVGALMKRIRSMAQVATLFPNKLIVDAIIAGTTATTTATHDGVCMFHDTHPARGSQAAQDNLLAGTGVTTATIQADLTAAIAAMMNFRGENAEPLNDSMGKLVVVAPPAMFGNFSEVLRSNLISQTSQVRFQGMEIVPVFSPRLADVNDWYLFNVSGYPTMPFIYQERDPIEFEMLGEGTEAYLMREEILFSVRWRGALGYGHWGTAVKTVNS